MPWHLAFALVLSLAAIAGDKGEPPPDVTKGQIGGKAALYVMPLSGVQSVEGGAKFDRILPGEGCQVHLAPMQDLERDLVYDCSTWILPPEGTYRIWLEAPDAISEGYGVLTWDHEPFKGRGQALGFGLEPAGRVALRERLAASAGTSFRLVHVHPIPKGLLPKVFDRRVDVTRAASGVSMPVGPVLTGIFDTRSGEALALARPVQVQAGETVVVSPSPPKSGSDVMVLLTRPRYADPGKDEVSLTLSVDGKTHTPDVVVAGSDRVVAVWYALTPGKATLNVSSETLRLDPLELQLRPGKVTTHRAKLAVRPSVGFHIRVPEAAAETKMTAELRRANDAAALRQLDVLPNRDYRFDSVPAEPLELVLAFGAWQFRKQIDLTAGADESVVFDLDPLVVSGTVFHGRDPAAGAAVDFHADTGRVRVVANAAGRYEAILWRADDYVAEVTIAGESMPFVEGPFEVLRSGTVDVHVPRTSFVVEVKNAVTGEPVRGARVLAGSKSKHRGDERNVLQTATTDDRGRATLPPLREGSLLLRAQADGYHDSDPTRDVVESIDDEGSYEILLRPVGQTVPLLVNSADGRPAAGAEVWAVASAAGHQQPLWRGVADASGNLNVPRGVREALFLIRAEGFACAVRRLGSDQTQWTLSHAVAPLTLKLDRQSRLALWIDGVRVSGVALAFLTRSLEATGADGLWTARVPAQPLRVLAWRKAAIGSGAYDAVAETVPFPWPAVVEIRAVD